jgi:hypothetical protein
MAITQRQHRAGDDASALKTGKIVEMARKGGWLSTAFSALAVGLSCFSVYVSTLQGPKLEVYVPPTIHYGRDAYSEVFAIPITIANSGARSAAVLSVELEVQNLKTNATKRYYSAFLGEHPREANVTNRQFAPLSIPGRGIFSETVRFYPTGEALPRLVDAQGDYGFRLHLNTATPAEPSVLDRLQGRTQPAPVSFQMVLPWISDQQLGFRRATIAMHAKDWKVGTGAQ